MKKAFLIPVLLCVLTLVATGRSYALLLSLDPSAQKIGVGDTTLVDLNISGLGNGKAPSLGAFYAEITFDESIVFFDSVVYASLLGDTDPSAFETEIVTTLGVGEVSLDEFSFLFDFELDALQPSDFTLATLSFTGLNEGTSTLGFGFTDLSDAAFPASSLFPDLQTAEITVDSDQPVPEPATILFFVVGLIGLGGYRMRFSKKNKFSNLTSW